MRRMTMIAVAAMLLSFEAEAQLGPDDCIWRSPTGRSFAMAFFVSCDPGTWAQVAKAGLAGLVAYRMVKGTPNSWGRIEPRPEPEFVCSTTGCVGGGMVRNPDFVVAER